jgi:hypothetical protein
MKHESGMASRGFLAWPCNENHEAQVPGRTTGTRMKFKCQFLIISSATSGPRVSAQSWRFRRLEFLKRLKRGNCTAFALETGA